MTRVHAAVAESTKDVVWLLKAPTDKYEAKYSAGGSSLVRLLTASNFQGAALNAACLLLLNVSLQELEYQ